MPSNPDLLMLLDSVDEILWKSDENGKIEYINHKASYLLGFTLEEFRGRVTTFSDPTLPIGKETLLSLRTKAGVELRVKAKRDIFFNSKKEPDGFYGVASVYIQSSDTKGCQDLQKRVQESEALLAHQSRLAQMGQLLDNISHQWKQPLAEINALLLDMDSDFYNDNLDAKRFNWFFKQFEKLTSFMGETIDSFQRFMAPSNDLELFDAAKSVQDALSLIESRLKKHKVSIKSDLEQNCKIVGSQKEFVHVLLVILNNAVDALQSGEIKTPQIDIVSRTTNFRGAILYDLFIRDNGGGINAATAADIFDPYFTTKFSSRGKGIGLYMAKMIVENRMQGRLELTDTLNTTFRLSFKGAE